jgi:hypothetical protein
MLKFKNQTSRKQDFHNWTKAPYLDLLEPIRELVDNSIAANATEIHIDIDFDSNIASIEDNGIGLPTDAEGLERCFMFGNCGEHTSDLNEHGCGMKTAIAKLDNTDKQWRIYWKRENTSYSLKTSFTSDEHEVEIGGDWLGAMYDKSGVLITFPISRRGFSSLYATPKPEMKDTDDIIRRMCIDFEHTWMCQTRFLNEKVKIFINSTQLNPFRLPHDYILYDKIPKDISKPLSSGAKVNLTLCKINKDLENSWFNKTQKSSGFYWLKNGRFIQSDTKNSLYTKLYGSESHNDHNGFIAIINIIGKQDQTPATVPTKNKYDPNTDLFVEACEFIICEVKKFVDKPNNKSEESLWETFAAIRRNNFQDHQHTIKSKHTIPIPNMATKTTQLDGFEEIDGRMIIYEAKKYNTVSIQNILQLWGNWTFVCEAIADYTKAKPVLLIDASNSYKLSPDLCEKVRILASRNHYGFPLEVWNYNAERLYQYNV